MADGGTSDWTLKCGNQKHSHEHFNFRAMICSIQPPTAIPKFISGFLDGAFPAAMEGKCWLLLQPADC